jgi:hypothetical protein
MSVSQMIPVRTPAQRQKFRIMSWVRRFRSPDHKSTRELERMRAEEVRRLTEDAKRYTVRMDPDRCLRLYCCNVSLVVTPVFSLEQLLALCARLGLHEIVVRKLRMQYTQFAWLPDIYRSSTAVTPEKRGRWLAQAIKTRLAS